MVENIWCAQSILSAWDDLYDLVLVRWDRLEEWSPWNCILLTKDEAVSHTRLDHLFEVSRYVLVIGFAVFLSLSAGQQKCSVLINDAFQYVQEPALFQQPNASSAKVDQKNVFGGLDVTKLKSDQSNRFFILFPVLILTTILTRNYITRYLSERFYALHLTTLRNFLFWVFSANLSSYWSEAPRLDHCLCLTVNREVLFFLRTYNDALPVRKSNRETPGLTFED